MEMGMGKPTPKRRLYIVWCPLCGCQGNMYWQRRVALRVARLHRKVFPSHKKAVRTSTFEQIIMAVESA
jgi:hypothetical protein